MNNLARFSIGYVARIFSSDPAASRALLEKIFDPERLHDYAHIEVPALAHEIANIAPFDPQFAAAIYGKVFGYNDDSQAETRMSDSHILPLSSNASQDYDLARYSLAQYYPTFLERNPAAATEAVIAAVDGEAVVRGHLPAGPFDNSIEINGQQLMLREDGSSIWAWDRNSSHPQSMEMILGQFVEYLPKVNGTEAAPVLAKLFEKNRLALLWTRLLMVGAERPQVFSDALWALATNETVMFSPNVGNDAIDAVAAFYPSRSVEQRHVFEIAAFGFGMQDAVHQSIREQRLATLFQAIGKEKLVTAEAQDFLKSEEGAKPSPNARFEIVSSHSAVSHRQFLQGVGIDVGAKPNNALLSLIEEVKERTGLHQAGSSTIQRLDEAVAQSTLLLAAIGTAQSEGAADDVLCGAEDMAGDLCSAILLTAAQTRNPLTDDELVALRRNAVELSSSPRVCRGRAPRAAVVPALYYLCQHSAKITEPLQRLDELATDVNAHVRHAVVRNLVTLNDYAPEKMWEIANSIVATDQDPWVMQGFAAAFLYVSRTIDVTRTEEMLLDIHRRFPFAPRGVNGSRRNVLDETVAHLFALLYVWHDRKVSRDIVFAWAGDPLRHEEQIRTGLWITREAACAGYDADNQETRASRERMQQLLVAVANRAAEALEAHFQLAPGMQNEMREDGLSYAKCLEYACASYYYGSGAFLEKSKVHISPLETGEGKRRFLADTQTTLRRFGDIAVPHTMYNLVQLLDFLLDGDPEVCFDLFAHALTTSGRMQGFQLEPLGVDVLVRVVSRCLADFEFIFLDEVRRKRLIETLEVFVEAGWPAALRLMYRLPDALR